MNDTPLSHVAALAQALEYAETVLPRDKDGFRRPISFAAWVQSWSDTSCGFGGIAGQAFTSTSTILCWKNSGEPLHIAVFVGGRYAYTVRPDDPRRDTFNDVFLKQRVPGADEWFRTCKHVVAENSNVCIYCSRGLPMEKKPAPNGRLTDTEIIDTVINSVTELGGPARLSQMRKVDLVGRIAGFLQTLKERNR